MAVQMRSVAVQPPIRNIKEERRLYIDYDQWVSERERMLENADRMAFMWGRFCRAPFLRVSDTNQYTF